MNGDLHTEARLGWQPCASDSLLVSEPHNQLQLSERLNRLDPDLDMPLRTARTKIRLEELNHRGFSDWLFQWLGKCKSNKGGSKNDPQIGCRKTKLRRLATCELDSLRSECSVHGGLLWVLLWCCGFLLCSCESLRVLGGFLWVLGSWWKHVESTQPKVVGGVRRADVRQNRVSLGKHNNLINAILG